MQAENFYITPPEGDSFILFFFPLSPLLSLMWFALAHECEKIHFQVKACHCLYLALWPTPFLSQRSWELRIMWRGQKMEANLEFWKFLERHSCPQQVLCEWEKDIFFLKPLSLWLVCYCSMTWPILADTAGQISSDPGRPNLVSTLYFYFLLLFITLDKSEYPAPQAQLSSIWLMEEKGERDGDHCSLMSSHDFQHHINITKSALISPSRFFISQVA